MFRGLRALTGRTVGRTDRQSTNVQCSSLRDDCTINQNQRSTFTVGDSRLHKDTITATTIFTAIPLMSTQRHARSSLIISIDNIPNPATLLQTLQVQWKRLEEQVVIIAETRNHTAPRNSITRDVPYSRCEASPRLRAGQRYCVNLQRRSRDKTKPLTRQISVYQQRAIGVYSLLRVIYKTS